MKKSRISTVLTYTLMIIFFIICVYPLIWMVLGSLKTGDGFYSNIWGLPKNPQFINYYNAWIDGGLDDKLLNSIIITAVSLLVIIPVNSCAAYAIARIQFKFKRFIYSYLLLGIMIPAGILAIPIFSIAIKLGLSNTRIGLILVFSAQAIAMGVFIMRAFFITLPKSLEEAAMIDGCSRFMCFIKIILPLAKPGVVTQIIFSGLSIWNEYFLSSLMIRSNELQTLPIGIASFIGKYTVDYPSLFAALVIVTLPVIVIFIVSQKTFIEGVASGSVKG